MKRKMLLIPIFFLLILIFGVSDIFALETYTLSSTFDNSSLVENTFDGVITSGNAGIRTKGGYSYLDLSYGYYLNFYFSNLDLNLNYDFELNFSARLFNFSTDNILLKLNDTDLVISFLNGAIYVNGTETVAFLPDFQNFTISKNGNFLEVKYANDVIYSTLFQKKLTGFSFGDSSNTITSLNFGVDSYSLSIYERDSQMNFSSLPEPFKSYPLTRDFMEDVSNYDFLIENDLRYCVLYDSLDHVNQILCASEILALPDQYSLQRFHSKNGSLFNYVSFSLLNGKWHLDHNGVSSSDASLNENGLSLTAAKKVYGTNFSLKIIDFFNDYKELGEMIPLFSNNVIFPHVEEIMSCKGDYCMYNLLDVIDLNSLIENPVVKYRFYGSNSIIFGFSFYENGNINFENVKTMDSLKMKFYQMNDDKTLLLNNIFTISKDDYNYSVGQTISKNYYYELHIDFEDLLNNRFENPDFYGDNLYIYYTGTNVVFDSSTYNSDSHLNVSELPEVSLNEDTNTYVPPIYDKNETDSSPLENIFNSLSNFIYKLFPSLGDFLEVIHQFRYDSVSDKEPVFEVDLSSFLPGVGKLQIIDFSFYSKYRDIVFFWVEFSVSTLLFLNFLKFISGWFGGVSK